ncbi:hypothetical protein [Maridesulfovibrio hydrothermalis]|nr:hypothetical protein [Maridesulfovibrio hydrothermalis]
MRSSLQFPCRRGDCVKTHTDMDTSFESTLVEESLAPEVKTHTDMDTSFEAMVFIYLISNYLQSCFQLCPKKQHFSTPISGT